MPSVVTLHKNSAVVEMGDHLATIHLIHLMRPHQTGWPNWISLRSLLDGVHVQTHPCSNFKYILESSKHKFTFTPHSLKMELETVDWRCTHYWIFQAVPPINYSVWECSRRFVLLLVFFNFQSWLVIWRRNRFQGTGSKIPEPVPKPGTRKWFF